MKSQKLVTKNAKDEKMAGANKLAAEILEQIGSVVCVKLIELKPKVEELKGYFKTLKKGDRI